MVCVSPGLTPGLGGLGGLPNAENWTENMA